MFISPPVPQDLDTDMTRAFIKKYTENHESLPSSIWAVLAGDAFKVIVAALENGATDSKSIADYLKNSLKDLPGLTGLLAFDEKGDRKGALYHLYTVSAEGEFIMEK
jgi:branched-chain amino acid transport system substrate-binding protein